MIRPRPRRSYSATVLHVVDLEQTVAAAVVAALGEARCP